MADTPIFDLASRMAKDGMPLPAILAAIRDAELGKRRNLHQEFTAFWEAYPAKVGKGAAEEEYAKARKAASAQEILDGVLRYAAKRDDRPWCNPKTFLHQRRWEDQAVPMVVPARMSAGMGLLHAAAMAKGDEDAEVRPYLAAGGDLFGLPLGGK